jgi:hypothetical protein
LIGVPATLAATLCFLAGPAGTVPPADDLPLDLSWMAPASCPDADHERSEIRRRVGLLDPSRQSARISAEVEIRASTTDLFQLSLRTRIGDTSGERDLAGQDCGELADAAALVLALLINPHAALDPSPPSPVAAPPPPISVAPQSVPADAEYAGRARLAFGIEVVLAGGVLPGLAEGLAGRGFFQHGSFVLAARAGGFLPQDKSAALLPGARASFHLLEAALAVCARTSPGRRFGTMVCLGGAALRLHGESSGVSTPGQATAYWPEALVEVSGQLRLARRLRLRIAGEAHGLGSRPDFAILGLGGVYRPATASLRGALGVDMLF